MRRSYRQFGQILLWCGFSNVALAACFVVGANWSYVKGYAAQIGYGKTTEIVRPGGPVAAPRTDRKGNEPLAMGVQSSLKVPLTLTRIAQLHSADEGDPTAGGTGDADPIYGPETPLAAVAYETGATAEESRSMRVAPLIRKDRKTGKLEIGNFTPMKLAGDAGECLDMAHSMLGDFGISEDRLQVMTTSDTITIAKLCATNGSIIFSCRNNEITISPRKSRPDDKCSREG